MPEIYEPITDGYEVIVLVALTLLGACVGSFMNVVVYRLPRGMSVHNPPRSFCPQCKAEIPWWLNLPIISWLCLRGKSACCHKRIPARYWLVEVACAALFFGIAQSFVYETISTQLWLCLWAACMLGLMAMDWEEMVVHPWLAVFAAAFGLAAAVGDPTLADSTASTPVEGLLWSLGGALGGYLLFRLVALGGRLFFGKRKYKYAKDEAWLLRQVGDDIVLSAGETDIAWGEIFPESGGRVLLHDAEVSGWDSPRGSITLTETTLALPDGKRFELANYEQLSGSCRGIEVYREAMGSGDAWLALAIGALCGWQGVVFSLVGGSFIGLLYALVMRVKRGVPMPFGPALILAAYVWLFWGQQLADFYIERLL